MPLLEMFRGDKKTFSGTVTRSGVPVDLSLNGGAKLWFTAKRNAKDAYTDAVIKKSSGATGGITITPGTGGTYTVSLTKADTDFLTQAEALVYDVQLLEGGQTDPETIEIGQLRIKLDVTNTTTP